ncbi:hypothetical protein BKH41_04185 [Helicobacter sp. 12S02232-10]|uniref:glycosyltransferase family 2 protein n=1 Tax=Helicobacter sp. 12S02232-10 TaxID=1476197 RepID=UPI000BA53DFC|nr:glycosyltransferase family 2 protein [Helicobacter sp. 12S02232-10]PAF48833.1 hypothetical protein BKH41_04185 [Helicobacter sp. 12S02232-10]
MPKTEEFIKVSIITVVYNDIAHIAQTIESILSQTYPNIEYIIIDGDSTDGTKEIIQNYIDTKPACFKHSITKFVSEKDKGVYDAMNKAMKFANGEWCNFMNSGDIFHKNTTIEEIFREYQKLSDKKISVFYGDVRIIFDTKHSKIVKSAPNNYKCHHRFNLNHQSAFINTKIQKIYPYDTRFKIAADSDFFTKIYHLGHKFQKFEIVVCDFNLEGISSSLSWKIFSEFCTIGYKYNKLYPIMLGTKYIFWNIPRTILRNLLPKKYRNFARVKFGAKKQ